MPSEKFRKLLLSLKGFAPFVSEIRYEKNGQDLELSLSLQGKELEAKDLAFKRGSTSPHLTIIVTEKEPGEK
ncbi:MAG: hypothetical protein Q7S63_03285 [bacterium]|nr:hypothetical protein [bacterium]